MTIPNRSHQQRLEALERANGIRTKRAKLKVKIRDNAGEALNVLEDPPDEVRTMKVIDVLLAVRHVGWVKANHWLAQCHISPSRTVGGLSQRQRQELIVRVEAELGRATALRTRSAA